jgi:hypothetical protein
MSEDAILDALDAMIIGFKRQAPDEWAPSGHLETQVTTKKPSIPAALGTVGTVGIEKQRSMEGEEESNSDDERAPAVHSSSSKKAYESSIEFVTGAHSAHSAQCRTNPGEIVGHLKTRCPMVPNAAATLEIALVWH